MFENYGGISHHLKRGFFKERNITKRTKNNKRIKFSEVLRKIASLF